MKAENRAIMMGIPIISVLGSLWHFLYSILGQPTFFAPVLPANESVFDHLKLAYFPTLIFWVVAFFILGSNEISKRKWLNSLTSSAVMQLILIPCLFYFYRGAFGIKSVVIDIMIFVIAVAIGQVFSSHIYFYARADSYKFSFILNIVIVLSFVIFSYYPPSIPLFLDVR